MGKCASEERVKAIKTMWFHTNKDGLINIDRFAKVEIVPVKSRAALFGYPDFDSPLTDAVQLTSEMTREEALAILKRISARIEAVPETPSKRVGHVI